MRRHPAAIFCFVLGLFAGSGCDRSVSYPPGLAWDVTPPPSYLGSRRLAVTDNGDDTLAMVSQDSATSPRLLDLVAIGNNPIEHEGPHHLAASPDGEFIYFNLSNYVSSGGSGPHGAHGTGSVPGSLVKWSVRQSHSSAQVLVDRNPGDVILSADGRYAFVSHYDLLRLQQQLTKGADERTGYSSVYVVDTAAMQVVAQLAVCPTGHGMGLSPDGQRLYLTCSLSDELVVLDIQDPTRPQLLTKLKVGPAPGPLGNPAYAPYALTVHPGGTVWISDNQSGDVRAFDPQKLAMDPARVVAVGGVAMFSDLSSDAKTLYVPHQGDDKVTAVNLATLGTQTLPLPATSCLNVHALRVLPPPLGGAVVVCEGDHISRKGSLLFLDLAPLAVRGAVEVGLFPDGVALLPGLW